MYRNTPHPVFLRDYQPPEFLIDRVDLRFELDPERTSVEARLQVRRNPAATRGDGSLRLHGEQLDLEQVSMNDRLLTPADYRVDAESLTLLRVPDRFGLMTRVRIHPSLNTALEGLYQSGDMLCTQCEAEGFRRITYFLDRPDVMACYGTTLVADRRRFPVLLSNGNRVESRDLPDGRHLVRWEDPFPKPSYLFALIAGDLSAVEDGYTTASGRAVELKIYVEPHNLDKCDHAMRSLKKAMRWDEERFGREYDLDVFMIVAVSHFNMGAMENKGLNVFNDKYVLARPDTATDADFEGIEGVIAHEYFHNWTGNRITCRDWFQLSLKEGFTVYRDQEFSADMGSRGVKRINDVRLLRAHQFPEDGGPMAHPVRPESYIEINNFYTATVYQKGAEVVRMQANLLGPERFRQATDLYFERHDGQAVTTDDFVRCMEAASGRDLGQFRRWYDQAGTPELSIQADDDADDGTYTLTIRQHTPPTPGQPVKMPFHIPLAIGLLGPDGQDLPTRLADEPSATAPGTRVLELREAEQRFRFTGLPVRPVPSLLRGFPAPVKLRFAYSDDELLFLMAHDSDGFNRWDAAQTLLQRLLLALVADPEVGIPDQFFAAFRRALLDSSSDRALLAEVLTLPSESYLGDQMEVVDIDGIHHAHTMLGRHIGERLGEDLLRVYRDNGETGPYVFTPQASGRRALKNLALGYLMWAGDARALGDCQSQFAAAHNMTDVMAALRLLVDHGGAEGAQALDEFYRRWSRESLVLDKWFSVQATSPRPDTLARVIQLMGHSDFSLRNPNRVRSLVGAFCNANPVRFHAANGGGYRFLADCVLELDPLNPQIASRLLKAMIHWRRFDHDRQTLMRAEIARILAIEELSKDAFEVASKALEGAV
ncbi:aminopeptidase N [Thiocystis violascens]|uniref:Aminopeptidase N n=1 Tax=Thiocystis violascens (strain ATCC 17096 / DSM 198 / 6111) TaxID=765911 RepID=I3Y713_THIV6|nr:aminopeptidase N [Thiocystis violascens]AFL72781.1 aminopeptidase N [Thiocystis violascens DSM 198]